VLMLWIGVVPAHFLKPSEQALAATLADYRERLSGPEVQQATLRPILRSGPGCPVLPVAPSELRRVAQLTSVDRIAPRIPPTPFLPAGMPRLATGGAAAPLRGGRGHQRPPSSVGVGPGQWQLPTPAGPRPGEAPPRPEAVVAAAGARR
jgi:hypothetical protein